MKNKKMNIQKLQDKLLRHKALKQFEDAWAQLLSTGHFAVEANGGWLIGELL